MGSFGFYYEVSESWREEKRKKSLQAFEIVDFKFNSFQGNARERDNWIGREKNACDKLVSRMIDACVDQNCSMAQTYYAVDSRKWVKSNIESESEREKTKEIDGKTTTIINI